MSKLVTQRAVDLRGMLNQAGVLRREFHSTRSSVAIRFAPNEHNNPRAVCNSTAVPAVWPTGILPADSFINAPGETPGGPTNKRFVLRNANSSCLSKGIFARVFGSLRDSVKRIT